MDSGSLVNLWPYLATLALLAAIAWFSLRRGNVPGARPLSVACLFTALWLAGAVAELLVTDVSAKIAWRKFQVVCQLPAVTATTCFVLEYANPGRWLTRRTLALLSIPPLLALLLVLTNGLHHWYWPGFAFDGSLQPLHGPAIRIMLGYGLALVLVNTTAFVWLFIRSPQHRWPVAVMVAGQLTARALFAVESCRSPSRCMAAVDRRQRQRPRLRILYAAALQSRSRCGCSRTGWSHRRVRKWLD